MPLGFASLRVPRNGRQPLQCLPVPPVPQQSGVLSRPSASRDWYMNGNYLVILVSVTIILPLALMKQLGKSGRCHPRHWDLAPWVSRGGWWCQPGCAGQGGDTRPGRGFPRTHRPLSSLPRLPWLRQRLFPQLHGLLPHLGEHSLAGPVPWGAEHPSCQSVGLGWWPWGQRRQRGQRALGAAEAPWLGCQSCWVIFS